MAAEFIGLQMEVTLRDPPKKLLGTISAVDAGAGLTLSNVWWLDPKRWEPRVTISSANIADIAEKKPQQAATITTTATTTTAAAAPIQVPQSPHVNPPFPDPAILFAGSRPKPTAAPEVHRQANTSEKRDLVESSGGLSIKDPTRSPLKSPVESLPPRTITPQHAREGAAGSAKKTRRGQRKPRTNGGATEEEDPEGNGWGQPPFLKNPSLQPFTSRRKGPQAGWASVNAVDNPEMDIEAHEVGVEKLRIFREEMRLNEKRVDSLTLLNTNKSNKNFLHSENVLPSTPPIATSNDRWNSEADDPMLNTGRLSGSRQSSRRGDSTRASDKAAVTRRSQSRRASGATGAAITGQGGPSRVTSSGVSHRAQSVKEGSSRPSSRLSGRVSIDKKKNKQPQQHPTTAGAAQQGLYVLPSKRRVETVSALQMLNLENIAHNEIGLTEDMMTENAGRGIAEVTLTALSDPAIKVRHAGSRSVVDPIIAGGASVGNNSSNNNNSNNSPPPPQTVVVLAGNNKSGIRAVAAARHLRNKGINVLVCVVGLERGERDLLEDMRQQVRLYKNLGGRVFGKSDFFEHIRKISIPMLTIDTPRTSLSSLANPAPVMLIIDALLGLAISFEELRNGDQATVYELIEWANRNEAFVLAIDIPTGIDPSTGRVSVVDGNRLYVRPRYVVAIGAPKRGLVEAMAAAPAEQLGSNNDLMSSLLLPKNDIISGDDTHGALLAADDAVSDWRLFMVDMGLGPAVWKKAGTKMRRGIDFDDRWVLEMRYQGSSPPVEGEDDDDQQDEEM